jgi:hypothetical protein
MVSRTRRPAGSPPFWGTLLRSPSLVAPSGRGNFQNEAASVPRLLLALDRQRRLPSEIVCVDAGSSDDTTAELRSFPAQVPIRVIEEGRLNPGEARNVGVRAARQDWIAFADGGTGQASWISA